MTSSIIWLLLVIIAMVVQLSAKKNVKQAKGKGQPQGTRPLTGTHTSSGGVYIPKPVAKPAAPPADEEEESLSQILAALGVTAREDTDRKMQQAGMFGGSMAAPNTEGNTTPAFEPAPAANYLFHGEENSLGADSPHDHPASPFTQLKPQVAAEVTPSAAVADEMETEAPSPLHLNFESAPLLNAIVLQEVLTRPGQRRRAGMYR